MAGEAADHVRTWSGIANAIVEVGWLSHPAFTQFVQATTPDGFNGEWRDVVILTVDGDMINRCEIFDEDQLDIAVSRFDAVTNP